MLQYTVIRDKTRTRRFPQIEKDAEEWEWVGRALLRVAFAMMVDAATSQHVDLPTARIIGAACPGVRPRRITVRLPVAYLPGAI